MDLDFLWLLFALPVMFGLGWLASRLDLRQLKHEEQASPKAYFKGLNLLLNEQQDKAIDAFIEAIQHDPDTTDLHFALGNLFRRRGEYERAVRVHQHLLGRADLPNSERERAQYALAQDFLKAGLFDRAEETFKALEGTAFTTDARLALLALFERTRDWHQAIDIARRLEQAGAGSFNTRIAHYWCELAHEADARNQHEEAEKALTKARETAPQAARPLVMRGQRQARSGHHAEALQSWNELVAVQIQTFPLVALEYVHSAQACQQEAQALDKLAQIYERVQAMELVQAMLKLEHDETKRRALLLMHLEQHPSLSASVDLLQARLKAEQLLSTPEAETLQRTLAVTTKPLRRYRCASCGFEPEHYFWHCPGCQGWETYPPRWLPET